MEVDSGDAGSDGSEDFPGDRVGLFRDFGDRDVWAEEFDFVADGTVGERGDVGHDLIHGDSPEERAAGAVDGDFGIVAGDRAGVAVAVADADRCDAGGAIEDGGAAVGDPVASGEIADEGDAGFQGHDRLQTVLMLREGSTAVEHEAGANEVGGAGLVSEEAGGVGKMNPDPRIRSPEGRAE